jgi:hypothetical protein
MSPYVSLVIFLFKFAFDDQSYSLAAALGVTKLITVMTMNLVTLCCAAEV